MAQAPRGRPRSEVARRAILDATSELIAEAGYQQLTIQAIAARSGSGRQTIYRWWVSKAAIVADLVLDGTITLPAQPVPNSQSLQRDLTEWLEEITASLTDPGSASLVRALITAASDDQIEARLLYETSTGPYHQSLVDRLTLGKEAGQLRSTVDARAVADALIGTVLFTALTPGARPAPPSAVVDALVGY